jgi:hypothetical protein
MSIHNLLFLNSTFPALKACNRCTMLLPMCEGFSVFRTGETTILYLTLLYARLYTRQLPPVFLSPVANFTSLYKSQRGPFDESLRAASVNRRQQHSQTQSAIIRWFTNRLHLMIRLKIYIFKNKRSAWNGLVYAPRMAVTVTGGESRYGPWQLLKSDRGTVFMFNANRRSEDSLQRHRNSGYNNPNITHIYIGIQTLPHKSKLINSVITVTIIITFARQTHT